MGKRRNKDAYYTPTWAAESLLKYVNIKGGILEPCTGENAITNVLRAHGCIVATNDIIFHPNNNYNCDAKNKVLYDSKKYNWVITNPPFSDALKIVQNAVESGSNVAMFLRLSFLEPTYDRSAFLERYPPDFMLVLPRISFTGDNKTDSVTCAWMVWYNRIDYKDDGQPGGILVEPKKEK